MSEKPGKLATWNFCHSLVEVKEVGSCQRPRTCCRIVCQKSLKNLLHKIFVVCIPHTNACNLHSLVLLVQTNTQKFQCIHSMQYLVTRTLCYFITLTFVVQKMRSLADDVKCGHVL